MLEECTRIFSEFLEPKNFWKTQLGTMIQLDYESIKKTFDLFFSIKFCKGKCLL